MIKNTKNTKRTKSNIPRVIFSLVLIIGMLAVWVFESGELKAFAAGGPKYGTLNLWRWDRIDTLPGDYKDDFYGLILYDAEGTTWFSSGNDGRSEYYWSSKSVDKNPYINNTAPTFYTRTRLDSPFFTYKGTDPDNENCNTYSITTYVGDTQKDRINYHYDDLLRSDDEDEICIIDKDKLKKKAGITMKSGEFQMFFNRFGIDTFLYGRSGEFYGAGSGGGWKGTKFSIYRGTEVTYSCLNSDHTIDPDQVMIVDSNVIISEDVTLTVPEGAVLVVKEGSLFVNGSIEVKGGTVLVEKGGVVMPFESKKNGCRISLFEGGSLIVRSGGRVYAGCPKGDLLTGGNGGFLDAWSGSTIINYGLLAAGQYNLSTGSTVENHKNGKMLLGYRMKSVGKFLGADYVTSDSGALGLSADKTLGTSLKSTIVLYEGGSFNYSIQENKGKVDYGKYYYSDGKIDYSTKTN